MFGFFDSPAQKARSSASNWLELAQKVWHYRRDVLSPPLLRELEGKIADLRALVRTRADSAELTAGMQALESVLRRTGGTHYPRAETVEWVEFLLVAAIVIIGVRTYFIQPFQIPTNSMFPSYHGMTAQIYSTPEQEPGKPLEALRFLTTGARPRRLDAPATGEVLIPLVDVNNINGKAGRVNYYNADGSHSLVQTNGNIGYDEVPDRSWFVFNTEVREYRFLVGDQFVSVRVPEDFDFDWVVRDAFFSALPKETVGETLARVMSRPGATEERVVDNGRGGQETVRFLHTGKIVPAGGRVLAFDVIAGDMLMVDRFSYHFVRPSVGSGFVFRTDQIPEIKGPASFYIKRLVGLPGDTLEVQAPVLYRNGQPITGAASFAKEAQQIDNYPGYRAERRLDPKNSTTRGVVTVPDNFYFAMGDNSPNSSDSRYWGFVPAASVIGRPILVYFPFLRFCFAQ